MARDSASDDSLAADNQDAASETPQPPSVLRLVGAGIALVIGLGYFWGAFFRAPYTIGSGSASYTLSSGVLAVFGFIMVFGAIVLAAEWYVNQPDESTTE